MCERTETRLHGDLSRHSPADRARDVHTQIVWLPIPKLVEALTTTGAQPRREGLRRETLEGVALGQPQ